MTRPLLLAALLIALLSCSAHSPSAEPDDPPDRLEQAAYSNAHAGDALVVWRDGEVVLERAQNGYDIDEPHYLASGTKSFAGVAALAAVADWHLSLDERVAETISAWQDDPKKSEITVRQLLHLTSGLDPGEARGAPPAQRRRVERRAGAAHRPPRLADGPDLSREQRFDSLFPFDLRRYCFVR